jgi:hypothetical protein
MDISFDDHPSFHRAAAGMVGGSLLLGLALHPFTALAPYVAGVGGIALGTSFAYGKAPWRLLAGAAAMVPLLAMSASWTSLALVATMLSLGLVIGLRSTRALVTFGLGIVTVLVAMWCAVRIDHARQTAAWSGWLRDAVAAMAMGMVGILAMLPRHLRAAVDPVRAAMRQLPANLDGEVRQLCERAVAIWTTSKDKLAEGEAGRTLIKDGVLKTIEVAAKRATVATPGASEVELTERMAILDGRIEATTDAETRTQYQAARSALDDQRRYRQGIRQGIERLVARMHNHVAALEKFQLAASNLEATRMSSAGAVKELAAMSSEVAASGEALAEVEMSMSDQAVATA